MQKKFRIVFHQHRYNDNGKTESTGFFHQTPIFNQPDLTDEAVERLEKSAPCRNPLWHKILKHNLIGKNKDPDYNGGGLRSISAPIYNTRIESPFWTTNKCSFLKSK